MTVVHDITSSNLELANKMADFIKGNDRVKDIRDLTLLQSQPYKEIKLAFTIILDNTLSLAVAHDITTGIEQSLRTKYPQLSRIVIHSEQIGRAHV